MVTQARPRRGLYQGWIGSRNLGDEAIFQACVRSLPHIQWTPLPFADGRRRTSLHNRWQRGLASVRPGSVALLGGGTVINRTPDWLEQYRLLCRSTRRPVPVLAPGVADPEYWETVPGWQDERAAWCEELSALPEIGVRGPRSQQLLAEAGLGNAFVAGDPALAFHRGPLPPPPAGRRTVAVNAGRTGGLMWGSEDRALAALAEGVQQLAVSGFRVRLFPMWHGDEPVCREVARVAGLPDDVVDPLQLDATAFISYLDRFDVVVSLKLHGAVLAAAAGIPFLAIEYQPKVWDFVESIGWPHSVRTDALDGRQLARTVEGIYDDPGGLRAGLAARVGELARCFRAYAQRLEEFLLAS